MPGPIKILLLIPHLGGGGAERVTAQLARHLNPRLFEIQLCAITPDAPGAEEPPPWVRVYRLESTRVRHCWPALLRLIRTVRPDVILSNMAHLNFLVLLLKPFFPRKTNILIRQNTTASAFAQSWLTRQLYRWLYPRAHQVICQSREMAADLAESFAIDSEKLIVLFNPIDIQAIRSATPAPQADMAPHLLCAGRLAAEKGLDLLLAALPTVRARHPDLRLTILGVGPEESRLRQLANRLGIEPAIHFAGFANPADYYASATLFVLPSRHEGMPNSLLAAAAAGLPLVATPCCPGLVELLKGAPGTWLANAITPESLAEALLNALGSLPTPSARFDHPFLAPFETETAIAAYEAAIVRAVNLSTAPSAMPHIAMIIPTIDQIGGAERQVLLLAKALAASGWPITVIALSGNGQSESQSLTAAGVGYLSLQMRKAWIDPLGWIRYLRWARRNHPAIVHAHLAHATWFARCVRLIAPVRLVVDTIHTSATGGWSRRLGYFATGWLTSHITCVSQSVLSAATEAGMVRSGAVSVLPNGVSLPEEQALPASHPSLQESNAFRWIAVGRMAPVKDYPTLLQALAKLSPNAHLQIVGSGPEEPSLRQLAAALKIDRRVEFAGFHTEIQPLLDGADAFVLTSLWEGHPVSVLEASAARLPVIATDGEGTREAMLPGETGLLVPVGDVPALAAAMQRIMDMPASRRHAMGARGRQLVEDRFSLPVVLDQWQSLYQRLVDQHPRSARTGRAARRPR